VLYAATPVKTSLAILDNKWDNLFDYNLDAKDTGRSSAIAAHKNAHPDTVEASLRETLNATDKDRSKLVSELKDQHDKLTADVNELNKSLKGFSWRYS